MLTAAEHTELYRNAVECQYLHPYSIKEPAYGSVFTSEDFVLQDLRAADADVITDGYRKRIQPVSGSPCQILELFTQHIKQGQQKITEPVQAPAITALV